MDRQRPPQSHLQEQQVIRYFFVSQASNAVIAC